MNPAVVGIGESRSELVPTVLPPGDISPKGSQNRPVIPFDFPVSLGVVGRLKDLLYSELRTDGLEKLGSELRSIVRKEGHRCAIDVNLLFTERSRHRQCGNSPKGDGLGHLRVPIRDNE
jgi:hypothetical protein